MRDTTDLAYAKADGLFNRWFLIKDADEFKDMIQVLDDAGIEIDPITLNPRVVTGRYVRRYPCFGYLMDTGVPECGPFAAFIEVDIGDARTFVEKWNEERKKEVSTW